MKLPTLSTIVLSCFATTLSAQEEPSSKQPPSRCMTREQLESSFKTTENLNAARLAMWESVNGKLVELFGNLDVGSVTAVESDYKATPVKSCVISMGNSLTFSNRLRNPPGTPAALMHK